MRDLLRIIAGDRRFLTGLGLILFLSAVAVLAPLLAPYDPTAHSSEVSAAPSLSHLFGTDFYGRDLLSRVMYAMQISLAIALSSILLSASIGTGVGLVAGYFGGWLDATLMRLVDAALAVPRVFLMLVVLGLWQAVDVFGLVVMLGLTSWFGVSRLVRAEVLGIREREYVLATRSLGIGTGRVLLLHVLPNAAAPILVATALGMGQIILIEAGLSFLGLGVQEPTASLGRMIALGRSQLLDAPWTSFFPGMTVVLIVIGFSLLGDGIRNALDPRST